MPQLENVQDYEEEEEEEGGDVVTFIENLIRANAETLRSLAVGQEPDIFRTNYRGLVSRYDDKNGVLKALALKNIPLKLSSPTIIGLNVSPAQSDYSRSIDFSRLRNLTLESCPGSADLIQKLAATVTTDE